jgi:outer membrane protein OmpA-like peptidoglycan-associated protein
MNHLRKVSAILSMAAMLATAALLTGCASSQQSGTGIGAATGAGIGAIVGQAIGRDTKGTLIGAGIGALAGGIAGNLIGAYMDKQEQQLRQIETASVQREQDVLTATFQSDLFFDFDSADLKPGAFSELNRVANVLNSSPQTTILVEGHTDATGKADYNQKLSERRALSVKNALVQRGVDSQRIDTVGYGASQIISSNNAANRRVVVVINPVRQG